MKLVCLNLWQGKRFDALSEFIREISSRTDVFCFQEVFHAEKVHRIDPEHHFNLLNELAGMLPDFRNYFAPMLYANDAAKDSASGVSVGNATFVRTSIPSRDHGSVFAFGAPYEMSGDDPHNVGMFQHVTIEAPSGPRIVCNFHGIAAWPKHDNAARFKQLARIQEFLESTKIPKILCGDFNLFPGTKSIAVLGRAMRNLTEEFGILTTRSSISHELYKGQAVLDTVSDYMFVSPAIPVRSFSVLPETVSDHLPLTLDFD